MWQKVVTRLHFIQQGYIAVLANLSSVRDMRHHVQICYMRELLIKRGKLVEVGGKQAERPDL